MRYAVVAAAGLLAVACGERPAPAPSPTAFAAPDAAPLRPLTSRDGPAPSPAEGATLPPGHPPVATGKQEEGRPVEGEIRLDSRLRNRAKLEDVLYVIARSSATRQVVAVRREERVRFPFAFRLSAGDTMVEGVAFEGPFDITARLSRSGDATPQTGDLEGTIKNVATGARGVTLIVDRVRP